ncbi:hypothetical protein SCHPADRAFT_940553 [Schizopora paradoxa]|uniref:DUF6533 domain-containing protein n=1 Tax=Schizopora paradoxa TaxID=27342 RepID=A0A0H2RMK5_9AGAM|nr:hypothetical protein SCHPADRAFT_940553 [Schizopora paradoxa]
MTQVPPSFNPTVITEGNQVVWTKYGFVAMFTLLAYDHFLTISEEVEYVWKRNFTLATWLFFLNRYYSILAVAVAVIEASATVITPKAGNAFVSAVA